MKQILTLAIMALTVAFTSCSAPSQTIENLKTAATAESNASAKYAAYSARAQADSLPLIAAMFAATAQAEAIHAANYITELATFGESFVPVIDSIVVDSTLANLYSAKTGEEYEVTTMYPDCIETAKTEEAIGAIKAFQWAMAAEDKHARFYVAAIQALENTNSEAGLPTAWVVCPKCGDTFVAGSQSDTCELCGALSEQFLTFNIQ